MITIAGSRRPVRRVFPQNSNLLFRTIIVPRRCHEFFPRRHTANLHRGRQLFHEKEKMYEPVFLQKLDSQFLRQSLYVPFGNRIFFHGHVLDQKNAGMAQAAHAGKMGFIVHRPLSDRDLDK